MEKPNLWWQEKANALLGSDLKKKTTKMKISITKYDWGAFSKEIKIWKLSKIHWNI